MVVQIVDGIEHLADRLGGVLLGELPLLANTVEQLSARSQLRDDVVLVLPPVSPAPALCNQLPHPRLEPVVEFDDVRVLQALQHLQLVVHHLLVAPHILLEDDLDRDLALRTVGLADNAICARAQRLAEAVA